MLRCVDTRNVFSFDHDECISYISIMKKGMCARDDDKRRSGRCLGMRRGGLCMSSEAHGVDLSIYYGAFNELHLHALATTRLQEY